MKYVYACFIVIFLYIPAAQAEISIDISKTVQDGQRVAVLPFRNDSGHAFDLASVIRDDLTRSGLFRMISPANFPELPTYPPEVHMTAWRAVNADALLIGQLRAVDGRVEVVFYLYRPSDGQQLANQRFTAAPDGLRALAHRVADVVYERLTGEPGAFSTRMLYVQKSAKIFRLMLADADGANARPLLSSRQPIMSPAWSPDGRQIAYVSFESGRSAIYVQTLATRERERMAYFPGINSAPVFSPDGRSLAMSLSKDGNPEIYVMDLGSKALQRLTQHPGIDTEPAFAPDGQSLIFTSDRSGSAQLYRISSQGGTPKRLTFTGSFNGAASYAPRGGMIALVHRNGGSYSLAVMREDGSGLQVLDQGADNQSPSFSPNGRMILYAARQGAQKLLGAVSVNGEVKQTFRTAKTEMREPAWSPN